MLELELVTQYVVVVVVVIEKEDVVLTIVVSVGVVGVVDVAGDVVVVDGCVGDLVDDFDDGLIAVVAGWHVAISEGGSPQLLRQLLQQLLAVGRAE